VVAQDDLALRACELTAGGMAQRDQADDVVIILRSEDGAVRMSSPAKWRRAITLRELARATSVELETGGRSLGVHRAGDIAALQPLFDELDPQTPSVPSEPPQTPEAPPPVEAVAGPNAVDLAAAEAMRQAYVKARITEALAANPRFEEQTAPPKGADEAPPAQASTIEDKPQGAPPPAAKPLAARPMGWGTTSFAAGAVALAVLLSRCFSQAPSQQDASAGQVAAPAAPAQDAPSQPAGDGVNASVLAGEWAPQGLTCENAVRLSVSDATLTTVAAGSRSSASVAAGARPDEFRVTTGEGTFVYRLSGSDDLRIKPPNGAALRFHRCAR
jgi:hypothetical protein